jgi:hypothetical protein
MVGKAGKYWSIAIGGNAVMAARTTRRTRSWGVDVDVMGFTHSARCRGSHR